MNWPIWVFALFSYPILMVAILLMGWRGLVALAIFGLLALPVTIIPAVWQWKFLIASAIVMLGVGWHFEHNRVVYDRLGADRLLWRRGPLTVTFNPFNVTYRKR